MISVSFFSFCFLFVFSFLICFCFFLVLCLSLSLFSISEKENNFFFFVFYYFCFSVCLNVFIFLVFWVFSVFSFFLYLLSIFIVFTINPCGEKWESTCPYHKWGWCMLLKDFDEWSFEAPIGNLLTYVRCNTEEQTPSIMLRTKNLVLHPHITHFPIEWSILGVNKFILACEKCTYLILKIVKIESCSNL